MPVQQPRPSGEALPRMALFVFDCPGSDALRKLLEEIPRELDDRIAEVVLIQQGVQGSPTAFEGGLVESRKLNIRFHRNPRPFDYGSARKAAFEYALGGGFDHVAVLRGDGRHPAAALAELLDAARAHPEELILACRPSRPPDAPGAATWLADRLERSLGTRFCERVLGLGLADYLSSLRIYPCAALRCIPYQLNADDWRFETELLIQFRALGVPIRQVAVEPGWRECASAGDTARRVLQSCLAPLDYRLHQLHVTRRGQYLLDHGTRYTLKLSRTGSHMAIVAAIRPGTRVLDLGCSQGLLAKPLGEKGVQVTGLDARPPGDTYQGLAEYYQRDLEEPCEIPVGRVFDYVVVADVIEHLRNRSQLLRSARRYLKEGGRLIISTGNVALWFYRLSLLAGRFEYGPRGVLDATHVHLYTRATFRREVERAGFHVLRERVTSLPFEVVFESTGRSRLIQRLSEAYHWLARLWPELFAYQFILEAEIETLDEEATHPPGPLQ
jgi:2-polyprenyl-3-methyl-5-hydroxy-6-metoxy-1,4-benzoquinol methylase